MSDSSSPSFGKTATFLGSLGGFLIFALIIGIAYLPHRPEPLDAAADEARQLKADEARAAGIAKLSNFAVAADGSLQVPIEEAMELVVKEYRD